MSFILDALKKSENERQRKSGPGFATVPESSSRGDRRLWPVVVAALLIVNLAVVAVVFWRDRPGPQPPESGPRPAAAVPVTGPVAARPSPGSTDSTALPAASGPAPTSSALSSNPPAPQPVQNREVRSLAQEALADTTPVPPGSGDTSPDRPVSPANQPAVAAPPRALTGQTGGTQPRASATESLPTANDLRLQGFFTGPPLHLELHVYYADPARRVVFISGSKYREGDTVKGGPVVREIVPQGVVLEERGRRYLLLPD